MLLTTKIIESGIDIPNANTILINRANNFGLAELYQLRGRVGRSNEQGYCYLIVENFSTLSKDSLRRLQAIEEFTELGSGLKLAMRDMEIRGAGNLLGGEQSGFIIDLGLELYQKILDEAVQELRYEEFSTLFEMRQKRQSGPPIRSITETPLLISKELRYFQRIILRATSSVLMCINAFIPQKMKMKLRKYLRN